MEHSLAGSVIDGWFIGGAPSFPPFEIGMPAQSSLTSVLARARKAASDPNFVAIGLVSGAAMAVATLILSQNIERLDHRKMERNVSVLVDDMAASCSKIFATGAGAASRSSVAVRGQQDAGEAQPTPALSGHMRSAFTKERVIRREEDQVRGWPYLLPRVRVPDGIPSCRRAGGRCSIWPWVSVLRTGPRVCGVPIGRVLG